ncbi:MAG: hypothetical protein HC795_05880 [Coleofasciculaceae cyanobacterium RL_1_1]|nr:hypothetical protein [Coleofasciculaceae cyanobacterium RL_1_1]
MAIEPFKANAIKAFPWGGSKFGLILALQADTAQRQKSRGGEEKTIAKILNRSFEISYLN